MEELWDNAGKRSQSPKTGNSVATYKTFLILVVIYEGMQQSVQENVRAVFLSFSNWYLKQSCHFDRAIQLMDFNKSSEKSDKHVNITNNNSR
jgi:hypothetical protein